MKIPADAVIPESKLVDYLLAPRLWDDKSKFLEQAGFTRAHPALLERAIRQLTQEHEAQDDGENDYGCFYRVVGSIVGPNNLSLLVVLIWLQWNVDGSFHFVTLKPFRDKR